MPLPCPVQPLRPVTSPAIIPVTRPATHQTMRQRPHPVMPQVMCHILLHRILLPRMLAGRVGMLFMVQASYRATISTTGASLPSTAIREPAISLRLLCHPALQSSRILAPYLWLRRFIPMAIIGAATRMYPRPDPASRTRSPLLRGNPRRPTITAPGILTAGPMTVGTTTAGMTTGTMPAPAHRAVHRMTSAMQTEAAMEGRSVKHVCSAVGFSA